MLNGERFIRETVESVLSQSGDFVLEYFIRDGGSTDGTLSILEAYADRCMITSEPDGSPQAAINAGMAEAGGDICCWLNADDVFEPGAIAAVARSFKQHPDRQWAYGRCRIIDWEGKEIRRPVTWYKNLLGFAYSHHLLLCENFINQPATFWRRELWEKTGGLSHELRAAFDYHLWLRMATFSRAISVRRYLSRFRRHDTSISEQHFEAQFDEDYAVARQYGGFLHNAVHELNRRKVRLIYSLLSRR